MNRKKKQPVQLGLNVTEQLKSEDLVVEIKAYKHNGKVYETLDEALGAVSSRVFYDSIDDWTSHGEFNLNGWLDNLRRNEEDRLHVVNYIKSLKP